MSLLILPSALEDLQRGYDFYEDQAEGLGAYFQESLFSDIESLKLFGGTHRRVYGYYRLLSQRFPYAIYYEKEGEEIRIRAVLDCRKNPKRIRKKLG